VCVGTSMLVEAEGIDRVDLALPGAQGQLLQDAAEAAGPGGSLIVVLFNAGGLDVAWAAGSDQVGAMLAAGFPGQTTGTAVADLLFGDVAPAGRLAVTWPKSLEQVGQIGDYHMPGKTFRYAQVDPLYPFGFGLSYTTFEYSGLTIEPSAPRPCETVTVRVTVSNTGHVPADEVVLAFVEWSHAPHPTPNRSLAAFTRVHLAAGSSQAVELVMDPARLAVLAIPGLHGASSTWMAASVSMRIFVGGQQPNMAVRAPSNVLSASFQVAGADVPLSTCT
jgi:beta-glucosidase